MTLNEELTGRIKFSSLFPPEDTFTDVIKTQQLHNLQYLITAMFTGAVQVASLFSASILCFPAYLVAYDVAGWDRLIVLYVGLAPYARALVHRAVRGAAPDFGVGGYRIIIA